MINSDEEYKFLVMSILSGRSHSERTYFGHRIPGLFFSPLRLFDKKSRRTIYEIALIAKDSFLKSAVTTVFSRLGAQYNEWAGRSVMKSHYVVLDERNLRKLPFN